LSNINHPLLEATWLMQPTAGVTGRVSWNCYC